MILKGHKKKDLLFVIEVKLYSDKSGTDEDDQLKRYYLSLHSSKNRSEYSNKRISNFKGEFVGIIYLKPFIQKEEIRDSIKELSKLNVESENNMFYLEWSNIVDQIESCLRIYQDEAKKKLYKSIYDILVFKNLQEFKGWDNIDFEPLNIRSRIFFKSEESSFNGFSDYSESKIMEYRRILFKG